MALVKYILEDNSEVCIEANIGQNLMQLAVDNGWLVYVRNLSCSD